MDEQQALQVLIQLSRMAPVNYESHAQGQQAAEVLTKLIENNKAKTEAKKS